MVPDSDVIDSNGIPKDPHSALLRREEELKASEERYRAFIANSSEGIWRLEFAPPINTSLPVEDQLDHAYDFGRLVECNDTMARMYGLQKAEELIGCSLDMMLPSSDPKAREYLSSIILAGYRVNNVESEERDAEGNTVYFENSMVGIVENGNLLRMWGTQRDITARRKIEIALSESETRYRETFENAAVGIAHVDLEGHWLRFNEKVCTITGYPREELLRKTFADITHPDDLELDWSNARRLLQGEFSTYGIEKRYIRPDQSIVWVNLTVSLERDAKGNPQNFLSIVEDITSRKQAEEALRVSLEAAEVNREKAEMASKAKDDFLAALSHELRTPLTPVLMGAAEFADDPQLPDEVRDTFEMIRRNISLEARLIDDLLDLTRITRGKIELTRSVIDAHKLLLETVEIVENEVRSKSLELRWELNAKHFSISADGPRLQQVIWNLLKNAVKFTEVGGQICVLTENPSPAYLTIAVRDNGIGIAPDGLERIFLPFHQGEKEGRHQFGGLGLGLSISKAIADLHGGRIWAESAGIGEGATFVVELAVF